MFRTLLCSRFMVRLFYAYFGLLLTLVVSAADSEKQSALGISLRGNLEQGGTVFGQVQKGEKIFIDGRSLSLTEAGDFVFGLDRDAPSKLQIKIIDRQGHTNLMSYPVKQRKYDIQRVNGVDQKHVTPSKDVLERIAREAKKVKAARVLDDRRSDFLQDFIWPLKGRITGVYGSQRVYNGTPGNPHFGLDIAGPVGAQVIAPASGLVTLAEPDLYFSGGTLILDHGHGISSTFIHLSKLLVKVDQRVERGQPIAAVGATGRATGPHLDWRINWFEVRLDPQLFMQDKPM